MAEEKKQECVLCQIIEGKVPSKKLYEDDEVLVILDMNGAMPGHSFVIPKEHFTIMEQVPDFIIGKLFSVSNKVSSAIFDTLNIQGTNIFVSNGVAAGQQIAHFMIQVVPRNENDSINLQWPTKQLNEEEMSTIELRLKDETKSIGSFEKGAGEPAHPEPTRRQPTETISSKENYLLRQLNRIP